MASFKTITIKKEVYQDLVKAKDSKESFSAMFKRLLKEKKPALSEFYGAWKLEKGEEKTLDKAFKKFRKEFEESFKSHESIG